jgi:hypothetical protein
MVVFERVALMTPDAETLTHQAHLEFAGKGMKALAVVMQDSPSRALMGALVKRVHGDTPCPLQMFESEQEANAWLMPLIGMRSHHLEA